MRWIVASFMMMFWALPAIAQERWTTDEATAERGALMVCILSDDDARVYYHSRTFRSDPKVKSDTYRESFLNYVRARSANDLKGRCRFTNVPHVIPEYLNELRQQCDTCAIMGLREVDWSPEPPKQTTAQAAPTRPVAIPAPAAAPEAEVPVQRREALAGAGGDALRMAQEQAAEEQRLQEQLAELNARADARIKAEAQREARVDAEHRARQQKYEAELAQVRAAERQYAENKARHEQQLAAAAAAQAEYRRKLAEHEALVGRKTEVAALAVDRRDGSRYGWAINHSSQEDADQRALQECQKTGENCQIVLRFAEGCGAYAVERGNGSLYGWGTDTTRQAAEARALAEARARGGKDVLIRVWGCNRNL